MEWRGGMVKTKTTFERKTNFSVPISPQDYSRSTNFSSRSRWHASWSRAKSDYRPTSSTSSSRATSHWKRIVGHGLTHGSRSKAGRMWWGWWKWLTCSTDYLMRLSAMERSGKRFVTIAFLSTILLYTHGNRQSKKNLESKLVLNSLIVSNSVIIIIILFIHHTQNRGP